MLKELLGEQPKGKNDYTKDGLVYCGECDTPKEMRIELLGQEEIVPCMCTCRAAEVEREREEDAERQQREFIDLIKQTGVKDKAYLEQTFDKSDGNTDLNFAKVYVDDWKHYRDANIGLMLYGDTGRGKTFAACCIMNALIEQGVTAMAWQFGDLVDKVSHLFDEDRDRLFHRIEAVEILLLDDFGVQRSTEFALEQAERIIDARYRARKPLIITTNLNISDFKDVADIRLKRTYERIIEMCYPKQIQGSNRRVKIANRRFKELKGIL